jgi:hypothetical protein
MAYSKEEQQSIVRQSSLKFMIDYCKLMDVQLSLMEMFKITNLICDYCAQGLTTNMETVVKAIDKHIASKQKEKATA